MAATLLILAAALLQDPDPEKLKKFEQGFVKKENKKKQEEPKQEDSLRTKRWDDDDDDHGFFDAIAESFAHLFVEIVAFPFRYAIEDHGMRFDDYPYAHGRRYFQDPEHVQKSVAFEAELATGRVEHDLWFVGLGGQMRWPSGCDFRFDISQYQENVEDGTDRLTLQEYGINFGGGAGRRSYQLSFGLGVGVLQGEEFSDVAPLVQAEFIHFPKEPLSLRYRIAVMAFDEATLTDVRIELGVHLHRFELTAGVRSLISSGGDDLTGPTLGLAVHF